MSLFDAYPEALRTKLTNESDPDQRKTPIHSMALGEQAQKAYRELVGYADHSDSSVRQVFLECWKLFQMLGIKQASDDKDGEQ